MKPYYQIDVEYASGDTSQLRYELFIEATAAMRSMVGFPDVESAILVCYSDRYPTGYAIICSLRNKPFFQNPLQGRKM